MSQIKTRVHKTLVCSRCSTQIAREQETMFSDITLINSAKDEHWESINGVMFCPPCSAECRKFLNDCGLRLTKEGKVEPKPAKP